MKKPKRTIQFRMPVTNEWKDTNWTNMTPELVELEENLRYKPEGKKVRMKTFRPEPGAWLIIFYIAGVALFLTILYWIFT